MKTVFLFPGQGSQFVGMGKDLYEAHPEVQDLYNRSEEVLGFPLKKISFEGPEEDLKQTRYTQPALYVHSMAVFQLLKLKGIMPDGAAGHSLGEYSAFAASGAFSFEDGLQVVKVRGEQMQQSGEKNPGTMAAVIGLSNEVVEELCTEVSKEDVVKPANFNSPGQVVISGSVTGVHRAMAIAKEKGARMVTELVVSGAFHSPLMGDATQGLTSALEDLNIGRGDIPVYTNVTARPAENEDDIRKLLNLQLLSPVLWEQTVQNMIADGATRFYEVGAGKVLRGLLKRINSEVTAIGVGTAEEIAQLN